MCVGLVGMDADSGPDIGIALGRSEHVAPLALARRNVEETLHTSRTRIREHFVLPLGKTGVVEVAVAVDQPHLAASEASSSASSRRGNRGAAEGSAATLPLSI